MLQGVRKVIPLLALVAVIGAEFDRHDIENLRVGYDPYFPISCEGFKNIYAETSEATRRDTLACRDKCVFRALDGTCNNLLNPSWGVARQPYLRLLPPDYCDGIGQARCSKTGEPLPNTRLLSLTLFQAKPKRDLDRFVTLAHMAFGQFLSHDIAKSSDGPRRFKNGVDVTCGKDQCRSNCMDKRCLPIFVKPGDPDFDPHKCIRFFRDQSTTPQKPLDPEIREQRNDQTAYLDLSHVYGPGGQLSEDLRSASDRAKMNTTRASDVGLSAGFKDLLPQLGSSNTCRGTTKNIRCFRTGDPRANEQVQLAAFHTLYIREHNRLVDRLRDVNPCWSDERLYLEARKINWAKWQYIVYREYLPLLLSEEIRSKLALDVQNSGFRYDYRYNLRADTSNQFQTVAFRAPHSQITQVVPFGDKKGKVTEKIPFSAVFFTPRRVYGDLDGIFNGMRGFPAEKNDCFFNKQITRSFDADQVNGVGIDLEATDIQRGRDHGIPSYNKWREFCGLPTSYDFHNLPDIPDEKRALLKKSYKYVDDIDAFVGGMVETPVAGSLTGPLLDCLIAELFERTKFGDRFWHEFPGAGFTLEQLEEIRTTTSARLYCDNLDETKSLYIQRNIFVRPKSEALVDGSKVDSDWSVSLVYDTKLGFDNERQPCSAYPDLDFEKWNVCTKEHPDLP